MDGNFVRTLFLLISLLCPFTLGSTAAKEEDTIIFFPDNPRVTGASNKDDCSYRFGYQGSCVRPEQCTTFHDEFYHHGHICKWENGVPITCCPDRFVISKHVSEKISEDNNYEDAVCGTRPRGKASNRSLLGSILRDKRQSEPDIPGSDDEVAESPPPEFYDENLFVQGGYDALRGAWPWMAIIGKYKKGAIFWFCGGSLINHRHVITAAHCIISAGKPELVRLGEHNIQSTIDDDTVEDYKVLEIIKHPNYHYPVMYNDVAILRLDSSVRYTPAIQPICLPEPQLETRIAGQEAVVTGWGHLQFFGKPSDILQEVALDIYNSSQCSAMYKRVQAANQQFPQGIDENEICAGKLEGGKDACQGDSGGPLLVQDGNHFSIIGIVSTGIGCGFPGIPGIYTRVSRYTNWIKEIAGKLPKTPN